MKFRPALVLLLAFTATCALAQSAADLGAGKRAQGGHLAARRPRRDRGAGRAAVGALPDPLPLRARSRSTMRCRRRSITRLLQVLDSEKVFFTQADMDKFAPLKTKLDDAI